MVFVEVVFGVEVVFLFVFVLVGKVGMVVLLFGMFGVFLFILLGICLCFFLCIDRIL